MTKIKEWFSSAANVIIVLVVAAISAFIYFLEKRVDKAEYKAGQLESDKALSDVIVKKDEAIKNADQAEQEYHRVVNEFKSTYGTDGDGPKSA